MHVSRTAIALAVSAAGAFGALVTACAYDWTYTDERADASKAGAGGGGNTVAEPPSGECSVEQPCKDGMICSYADGKCGRSSPGSKCTPSPPGCAVTQVCTCDGLLVDECVAAKEGKSIDESGASCKDVPRFDCYSVKCTAGSEYCKTTKGTENECVPYATACKRDCTCPELPQSPCTCSEDADGNVIIKCL